MTRLPAVSLVKQMGVADADLVAEVVAVKVPDGWTEEVVVGPLAAGVEATGAAA